MRIARSMIYNQSLDGMNGAMSDVIRLNEQAASQKKINRPSDDPGGMSRVMDLQTHLNSLAQYKENIDSATGWLDTANEQLGTISNTITRLSELASQASNGTMTAKQRLLVATEVRELQEQLVSLANGDYAGNYLFSGGAIDRPAYLDGLSASIQKGDSDLVHSVTGTAPKTIAVRIPPVSPAVAIGEAEIDFEYSTDGGTTWQTAKIPTEADTDPEKTVSVKIGGVEVNFSNRVAISDTEEASMLIRPAAIYNGSINGEAKAVSWADSANITADVKGSFSSPVAVRIEGDTTIDGPIAYSYSLDNGATWIRAEDSDDGFLTIPGGQLELGTTLATDKALKEGDQFVVSPVDASIEIEVSPGAKVQVNGVGSDFFGGVYIDKDTKRASQANGMPSEQNLFEVVGDLIGFLEMNDEEGVKKCLGNLKKANEHITTETGVLGGRQARLKFAADAHSKSQMSTTGRISAIQDVDVAQLTTDSARAQYIYEAVLSTSAKVMKMSLLEYM